MRLWLFLVLVGLALLASPSWAGAIFVVDTTLVDATDINPGDGKCEWATFPPVGQRCTLRAAVHETNALPGLDYIIIPNGWKITLSRAGIGDDENIEGDLDILDDLQIETVATGLSNAPAVIDAAGIDRVFDVHSPAELRIWNLVITGGNNGIGAGVWARSPAAKVDFYDCILSGNAGYLGVALYAGGGSSKLTDCTVEGNRSLTPSTSSAVHRAAGGSLEILRSTIAANPGVHHNVRAASPTTIKNSTIVNGHEIGVASTADLWLQNVTIYGHPGDGLLHSQPGAFGSPAILNSVIAYNGEWFGTADCTISTPGGFANVAHPNLDTDGSCGFSPASGGIPNTDPLLGPLGPNGGRTRTMAPQIVGGTQSPVIDSGDNAYCELPDQRWASRPLNGDVFPSDSFADCDLGAVESLPCDIENPIRFVQNVALGNGATVACFLLVTGPMVEIQAGATHEFRVRQEVEIRNGFQVLDGATFSVILDPEAGSSIGLPYSGKLEKEGRRQYSVSFTQFKAGSPEERDEGREGLTPHPHP